MNEDIYFNLTSLPFVLSFNSTATRCNYYFLFIWNASIVYLVLCVDDAIYLCTMYTYKYAYQNKLHGIYFILFLQRVHLIHVQSYIQQFFLVKLEIK